MRRGIRDIWPVQACIKDLKGYVTEELRGGERLHNGLIRYDSKGIQFILKFGNYQTVSGSVITIL